MENNLLGIVNRQKSNKDRMTSNSQTCKVSGNSCIELKRVACLYAVFFLSTSKTTTPGHSTFNSFSEV